jgi:hypothetical protein
MPFSVTAWLAQHDVARVDRDAACAAGAAAADAGFGLTDRCDCREAISLVSSPPVDMLVCRRSAGGPGGPVAHVTHTLLYAAEHQRLRLVLDVATDASTGIEHIPTPGVSDEQNSDWLHGNNVHLGVRADGDRVSIFDRGDGPHRDVVDPRYTCAQTISRVGRPGLAGEQYLNVSEVAAVKRAYHAICDSTGEWRWNGSTLVRVPPSLSR